jgi:hypothetical protein
MPAYRGHTAVTAGPPGWAHVEDFLAGWIDGIRALAGVSDAEGRVDEDQFVREPVPPTCRIEFTFEAGDENAAEAFANDVVLPAGLKAGFARLGTEDVGWMGSTAVEPA